MAKCIEKGTEKSEKSTLRKTAKMAVKKMVVYLTVQMEIKKMRCVIYTRVSTEDQTVENQISQLKEYAERQVGKKMAF